MKPSKRHKELETIIVLVLGLGLFYWFNKNAYFLAAAFITGFTGLLIPAAAKLIHYVWMKLAEGLGFVTSRIILVLVFLIIVIPLGWFTRKTGKSSVKLKPHDGSYYRHRDHTYTRHDLENQW